MHDDAKETDAPPGLPNLSTDGIADLPPAAEPSEPATDGPTEPGTDAPRKRRRRRGPNKSASAPAAEAATPSADEKRHLALAIGAAFGVAGDMLAAARGEHFRISEQEKDVLGTAWAEAVAPFMGTAGKWMPFVVAGVHTVGVFIPKVQADRIAHTPNADARQVTTLPRPVEVVPMADIRTAAEPGALHLETAPAPASLDIEPPKGRTRNNSRPSVSP